jgi:serine/threonine protein phosphatase PrpC
MYKYLDKIENHDFDNTNYENFTQQIIKLDSDFMENYHIDDGTTAIFAITQPNQNEEGVVINYKLVVGNIGDSRAVLGRNNNEAKALSEDHKPSLVSEQRRIETAGGFVSLGRVRGNLALSRAIGDRQYKVPKDFPPDKQQVSCIPDYQTEIVTSNDFLFIACDGIYEGDIFSYESIVQYISEKLQHSDDLAQITSDILDECVARGSKDNMSAMLIQFKDGTSYNNEDQYIPGPYYEENRHQEFQEAYKLFAEKAGYTLEESRKLFEELEQTINIIPVNDLSS